jgi:hypothetical protein
MGKRVTVKSGYTDVVLPQATGLQPFNGGQTADLTNAEYAALNASTLNALVSTTTTIPDPARPTSDVQANPVNAQTLSANGALTLKLGVNVVTMGANATSVVFPTVPAGSSSTVDVVFIQDATGGRTVTWTGSGAKFAGGTAFVLTTPTASVIDRARFVSRGDGATWDLLSSAKALA